jgi:lysophospholipase L1-like esterase
LPPENPNIDAPDGTRSRGNDDASVQDFNTRLMDLASQTHATLVDLRQTFPPTSQYLSDGLHPTQSGYTEIAKVFNTVIQSTFEVSATTTSLRLGMNPDPLGPAIQRHFEPRARRK